MKLSPYHLTYCTNVHAGADWETMFANLRTYAPRVKAAVSPDAPFGLGLWLSNVASEELKDLGRVRRCKEWMKEEGLYLFTLNGFPYGTFHDTAVKDQVYAPDWTTRARVDYTKRLFDQLAFLLPEQQDVSGGVSTCPISYRHWFLTESSKEEAMREATVHFIEIVEHLHHLAEVTGHVMHLDIEPEPDGILENSDEIVAYFTDYLLPIGVPHLTEKYGWSAAEAEGAILRHLQVCYDVCHFALAFEDPAVTFAKFDRHGIRTGKIQVSSALKILLNGTDDQAIWDDLERFVEPTYLHQVTQMIDGRVHTFPDLPKALAARPDARELRAHFHVPIFLREFGRLRATQDQILSVLKYLEGHNVTEHLEVETYTWDVLPAEYKEDLTTSISREMLWFRDKLISTCAKQLSLT